MKKINHCLCLVGSLMLFFRADTQAQTHNANLHGTVTHEDNAPARMPISDNSHKEDAMPQADKDFGTWNGLVNIYKQYFTVMLPKIESKGFGTGIPLSTLDYKQWTKDDLRALATSYNGFDMFESLIIFANAAVGNGTVRGREITEQEKKDAQAALQDLAPNGMSWKKFYNIIADLQEETEAQREVLRARHEKAKRESHGALLKEISPDIVGDPNQDPSFDQKTALALLEKAGVIKDPSDHLKKPLETAVTDAVKGVKSSITLAA